METLNEASLEKPTMLCHTQNSLKTWPAVFLPPSLEVRLREGRERRDEAPGP